ncbi:MAG: DNA repair protein RecN [Desulfococcus sp. 4484_241]|nr:MAG: DNA repair protein RecN [Desulfococcus sp. 4484_241]
MIQEIAIKNFAIIDDLRIRFDKGLTILSGETGAGKSIIINAVNLLLGSRASATLIRTGEKSAEVEAVFLVGQNTQPASRLKHHGYEPDEQIVVKRIISSTNHNRIYINGSLATMQVLADITGNLASISGQHAHQQLLNEDIHLLLLDAFAGLSGLREKVASSFNKLLPMLHQRRQLLELQADHARRRELLEFQRDEIEKARVAEGEDEKLERERKRLKNARELYALVYESVETLYDANGSIIEQFAAIRGNLEKALNIDDTLGKQLNTISEMEAGAADLAGELRGFLSGLELDETSLEQVEERLDTLTRLKKKYGSTLADVISRLEKIKQELAGLENLSEQIDDLEKKISKKRDELSRVAVELSGKRQKAGVSFARSMEKELSELKMEGTKFDVVFSHTPAGENTNPYLVADGKVITESGIDKISFHMTPNVGEEPKPLASIASGGELSRVVLAIKALLAGKESVETLIFDEVDAGIGGETAEVVGRKLAALSRFHQTICITHLPQIAKFDHHYRIEKHVESGRTTTKITRLDEENRVLEIARMTGGKKITEKTLAHAREMLENVKPLKDKQPVRRKT